jgi:hypothetical protein
VIGRESRPSFLSVASTLRLFGDAEEEVQRRRFVQFVDAPNADDCPSDRIRSAERVIGTAAFKREVLHKANCERDTNDDPAPAANESRATAKFDGGAHHLQSGDESGLTPV